MRVNECEQINTNNDQLNIQQITIFCSRKQYPVPGKKGSYQGIDNDLHRPSNFISIISELIQTIDSVRADLIEGTETVIFRNIQQSSVIMAFNMQILELYGLSPKGLLKFNKNVATELTLFSVLKSVQMKQTF